MIVWCDTETTGLSEHNGHLLEVALVITDDHLVEQTHVSVVCQPAGNTLLDEVIEKLDPYVRKMHQKNGLLDDVRNCSVTLSEAEQILIDTCQSAFANESEVASGRCAKCKLSEKDHGIVYPVVYGEGVAAVKATRSKNEAPFNSGTEPPVDDPSWLVGFSPYDSEAPDLHNPVLADCSDYDTRLVQGICPICGVRYGKHGMDWSGLRRVDGSPGLWRFPMWEWLGPCGHRVRSQRKGAKLPAGYILRYGNMAQVCANGKPFEMKMDPAIKHAPLAGSTIPFDRRWLHQHMPNLEKLFSHRSIDVSSITELAKRWSPEVYELRPRSTETHRALADIRGSIELLRYYKAVSFIGDDVLTLEVNTLKQWGLRVSR